MIELGKYKRLNYRNQDLIRYAIENQMFILQSGYIAVNNYPDHVLIRYAKNKPTGMHRKTSFYYYDKDLALVRPAQYDRPRLEPLIPRVIPGDHGARAVALRIPVGTDFEVARRARKEQFDLAHSISPYWP